MAKRKPGRNTSKKMSPFLEEPFNQGVLCLQEGKYDVAAMHFNRGLKVEPNHPRFLHMMGLLTMITGDVRTAKEMLVRAVEGDPRNADANSDLAAAYIQSDDVDLALKYSDKAVQNNPQHAQAYNIQGLCRYYQKQYDKAEYCFQKSLKLEPNLVEAHNNLGLVYQALGDMSRGIKSAQQALSINPNYLNAYVNIGNMNAALGLYDASEEYFQKALLIHPNDVRAINGLGEVYRQRGDAESAIASFCEALKINPSYSLAYNNLGLVYKTIGETNKAIDCFESAMRVDPQDRNAPLNLGNLYFESQSNDLAKKFYHQVLELEPSNGSAQHMLSVLEGDQSASLPKEYVKDLFDGYAENFETHLVDSLDYHVPELLRGIFSQNGFKSNSSANGLFEGMLDLGCGTGLSCKAFKDLVDVSIGVELAPNMVAKARQSGLYKEVHCLDIIDFLRNDAINKIETVSGKKSFDICIATDVLVYMGELKILFELLAHCLADGAYFIFSTELTDQSDYLLQSTGRYAHSPQYFKRLCIDHGFQILIREQVNVRKHKGEWIVGEMYVLCLESQ
ncbi:MAG: tetratricopeptide repeat protein [Pseudomonadales bacterium]|nr:tetratricopeptide repeat protein [Pseudomonadales bacterium]